MNFKSKIFHSLRLLPVLLGILAAASACSGSKDDEFNPDISKDNSRTYLKFSIAPLQSRMGEQQEMIKSIRIVIVGADENIVECNHYVSFNNAGAQPIEVSHLRYEYTWPTTPGTKKVYLFANEESVTDISFEPQSNVELPETALPGSSLQSLLNSIEQASDADIFDNLMEAIYFSPDYTAENGNYFLPYVSVYDDIQIGDINDKENNLPTEVQRTLYLVPVATKFTFNFTNERDYTINVNEISLSYANSENFLFARVGDSDKTKRLPDQTTGLYWVDWLAEVSRLSYENSDFYPNVNFNDRFGWITDYMLPDASKAAEQKFFCVGSPAFSVSGLLDNEDNDTENPQTYSAGPFYVPESRNFINAETQAEMTEQGYYLTIKLEDTAENKTAPSFEKVHIENLKALFRNSHVIINIDMSQGFIKVYAEIADWNMKSVKGYVEEGNNAPNPNPFN